MKFTITREHLQEGLAAVAKVCRRGDIENGRWAADADSPAVARPAPTIRISNHSLGEAFPTTNLRQRTARAPEPATGSTSMAAGRTPAIPV